MSEERVEIQFRSNVADCRRALYWLLWKRLVLTAVLWFAIFIPGLYVIGYGAGADPFSSRDNAPFMAFLVLLMMPLLLGTSVYFGIWRQAARLGRSAEFVRIVFDSKGVETVTETATGVRQWDGFKRVIETKKDFIFLPKAYVYFSVPKWVFKDGAQMRSLKKLLREQMAERAKLRS